MGEKAAARVMKTGVAVAAAALAALGASCGPRQARPGTFQGIVEHEDLVLGFEVAGRVRRLAVHRGEIVKEGQLLAEIDDAMGKLTREARADDTAAARADVALLEAGTRREDVMTAAAQVRAAAATESLVRTAAERARALHETHAIAQAELDRSLFELDRAVAERRALEARLLALQRGARPEELARARARAEAVSAATALEDERLARHVLRSPGPGEVLDIHLWPGELASAGAPVVTVADTARPYVEVFVPQADLAGIHAGVRASVRVDAADASFPGAVEHVARATEFTPRYIFSERERPNLVVRVRVRIEDPERRMHAGVPAFVAFAR